MTFLEAAFSSKTDEWRTPIELFTSLDAIHRFTLDAAASDENHLCTKYYTVEQDGLAQDWSGERVWLNPPYGRTIGQWVRKAHESGTFCMLLVPARTDTSWWHDYCLSGEVQFLRGRLSFNDGKGRAPFPSALVLFKGAQARSEENAA